MKRVIIETLQTIVIFWFIWVLAEFAFLRFTDVHNYVYVQSVEPYQYEYSLKEKPVFVSNIIYKRDWLVIWSDIVFCKEPWKEEYVYYSEYISTRNKKKGTVVWGKRVYNIEWPDEPKDCYLESTTCIKLHYWIDKCDTYISWPYIHR